MAKVNFKRIEDSNLIDDYPIEDGSFWVTGDGKTYVDYDDQRISIAGTPDTQMSDISRNTVENNVIKDYVDNEIAGVNLIINNLQPKLLWTNPNPNSAFAAQNITLSSSDYDILEIYYYDWVDTNSYKDLMCQKTVKGHSTKLQMQLTHNDKSYAGNRRVLYVDDTTLQINTNYRLIDNSAFNTTAFNNWNVPIYIIGYKTGLFE